MVRLREVPRTAAFAWSPGAASPSIVTGTKAGAVDADFSSETQLELWDLDLNGQQAGIELQPVASIGADSRFHDLAWSKPNDDRTEGIIAGALDSGSLDLWDAAKLRTDSANAHISRTSVHTGAIKALQFNPFRHELLATSGAKGELFINDITNSLKPGSGRLGTAVARADDFDALDWNKGVPHILATGSSGGFVTVWDVKLKKESLTLKNDLNNSGRKAVSAIAWDPEISTKLATATSNDQNPLILMWDLRNSNAPERVLQGHDQGILSLAWSTQDPKLLLSCGKDNRTIIWNSRTGEQFGEFPVVTNWTFQTKWNPRQPGLIATASFDGKIGIQTIQNTNVDASQAASANNALDGADFFAQAQTRPQGSAFSLPEAPKWLERPVGATFGFGGKLVSFGPTDPKSRSSKITISSFVVDSAIGDASQSFEDVLQKGDMASFCEGKISEAKNDEEKADWTVIETLISGSRKKLVEYLGFAATLPETNGETNKVKGETNGTTEDGSFFDNTEESDGNFLSDLASTKGARTNNPFKIYTGSETDADRKITKALMLGAFEEALDVCLKEDRMSDAFMIAICGGQKCVDKAQKAYFKRKGDGPNYLRLLASVVGKNLWDVVYNADISNWKEVLATLCTFADSKEFPDLCEALGDRLDEALQEGGEVTRKDASLCYLAGSKLEKVVGNWTQELQEDESAVLEAAEGDSRFSIHANALQSFIEKVTIFRQVADFKDPEATKASDWKLEPLYAKYTEYADILASHGKLQIAERYLDLLPSQYPAAEAAKSRVKQATRKAPALNQQRQTPVGGQRGQRVVPSYASTQPAAIPTPSAPTPYGIPAPNPPAAQGFQVSGRQSYAPPGYQQQQQQQSPQQQQGYQPQGFNQPSTPYGGYQQQPYGAMPPPPQVNAPPPGPPPAAKVKDLQQWNDTPDFGNRPKPTSRRGTPSVVSAPVPSPYATIGGGIAPPPTAPFSPQQRATTPSVAPPPKAGAPRVMSPPLGLVRHQDQQRPTSSAQNVYSPPAPQGFPAPQQPTVPRGVSPYNPPPAGGASSNRYAPAPGTQPSAPQGGPGLPPPGRQIAPPPAGSPYAASPYGQPQAQSQSSFPPPAAQAPPPPPKGAGYANAPSPAPGPPPPGRARGPSQANVQLPPPQRSASRPPTSDGKPASPAPPKYPPGDRSHIPAGSQPILNILTTEMARIKARAPAQFRPQVLDTEKRLSILFDHLNNEDLLKPDTIAEMNELAQAIQGRQHDKAQQLFQDIMTTKTEQGSTWMVGVKRLIQMSRATPA